MHEEASLFPRKLPARAIGPPLKAGNGPAIHARAFDGVAERPRPPAGAADFAGAADGTGAADDPDRDLVDRAAGGDRAAFEALLRRHYDRIHRVAWRVTGSRSDAQDIAQDVCCALVEKIGSFKGEARFTTWLVGIVVNA